MSDSQHVVSADGQRGRIIAGPQGERRAVTVRFAGGETLQVPLDLIERAGDGSYRIAISVADLAGGRAASGGVGEAVIPVVEETVELKRRRVPGDTVRVHKRVSERDELIDEPIVRDEVRVERIPVGRPVTTLPRTRREGDTLIIPVLEEVLVVEKRTILKEEVRVTLYRAEDRHTDSVRLRSEEVVVERTPPDDSRESATAGASDDGA